ncbi:LysR family transcriptional regulator [uncultured Tateyamaria sp.]|uniref:LysR family transcriptional regulator n=1 Tax=uncultured Tateyamaria sp. TaxID=455651 RepID=UPI00262F5C6A|nr:LysR family transcriptional regulator [uncultured Tateyamaria sp.]
MRNISLKKMRVFVSVVECGAFGKAASKENITQPAATMIVNQIEEELGVSLFERAGTVRKAQLTSQGQKAANAFRNIISSFERELDELNEAPDRMKIIRIAIQHGLTTGLECQLENSIELTKTNKLVVIEEQAREVILEQLRCRSLHMGIIMGDSHSHHFDLRHIGDEDLVLVVPETACKRLKRAAWDELPDICFVSSGLGAKVLEQIEKRVRMSKGKSPRLVQLNSGELLGHQIRMHGCPVITSSRTARFLAAGRNFQCLSFQNDTIPLPIFAAGHRGALSDPIFHLMRNTFSAR